VQSYIIALSTFAAIYTLLALGLNLMWGLAGMVNLGILGYYALGGYVSALLTLRLGLPVPLGMLVGALAAALLGAATCIGIVRLRDDYLAIVTLGFAEVMRLVIENEIWLTNGTDGIGQIPRLGIGLTGVDYNAAYLAVCLVSVAVVLFATELLRTAPFGRVLRAIREDPMVAATAGKYVFGFQVKALAVGGGVMGFAGALYAHYLTYISPEVFQPQVLIYVFLALILGGRGNNWGALAGTFIVVFFIEGTRFAAGMVPGLTAVQVGALRAIIIGAGFILVLQKRPRGLFPERVPHHAEPNP
jgi:branched-chain amino acid transport system permease protein